MIGQACCFVMDIQKPGHSASSLNASSFSATMDSINAVITLSSFWRSALAKAKTFAFCGSVICMTSNIICSGRLTGIPPFLYLALSYHRNRIYQLVPSGKDNRPSHKRNAGSSFRICYYSAAKRRIQDCHAVRCRNESVVAFDGQRCCDYWN